MFVPAPTRLVLPVLLSVALALHVTQPRVACGAQRRDSGELSPARTTPNEDATPANRTDTPPSCAFLLDESGSMGEGEKLAQLKQSAKLAIALLEGQIHIVGFSDEARVSQPPLLTGGDARRGAMKYVDALKAGGDTNYPDALKALPGLPDGTPALLISDGQNTEGTDAQVLKLARLAPGPVHTIGIETTPEAQQLLDQIAAATHGAAVRLDSAEQLTKHMLKVAGSFGNYRAYTPQETDLVFPNTEGTVIAIGYGAVPDVQGTPPFPEPPFLHRAEFQDEHVIVSRVKLAERTKIEVHMLTEPSANGRLACVLRNDQLRARLTLDTSSGTVPAGGRLVATTEFFDKHGNRVDPRVRTDIVAGYALEDQSGHRLGTFRATSSPTSPVLTATIPLPDEPGSYTVVQGTRVTSPSGHAFDAHDRQTVIVRELLKLVAKPAVLTETAEVGPFRVSVTLDASDGKTNVPAAFQTVLSSSSADLKLLDTTVAVQVVTFRFDAAKEGDLTGTIALTDTSSGRFAALSIPFRFAVRPKYLGLQLPGKMDFGAFPAGSGSVSLKQVLVSSLDEGSVPYSVEATDLSNGTHVLSLRPSPATIAPIKGKPASVGFTAEIGDVPFGTYTGTAKFVLNATTPPNTWELPLRVVILDPLIASPVDFGVIEPGMIREATLVIRNTGGDLDGVEITAGNIQAEGGLIELSLPEAAMTLLSKKDTPVPVKLSVSPLVSSRGAHEGVVSLLRTNGLDTSVPVRLTVADQAPSPLVVSPRHVRLTGKPGAVVQFALSVKLGAGASKADELSLRATELTSANKTSTDCVPEFQWINGNAIAPDRPVHAKGFLVLPSAPGTYRGEIVVKSTYAGTKTVALTVNVR